MMNIQKKSLQHVSDILDSFDIYPIYSALIDAMLQANIDTEIRSKIMEKYQIAISEQSKKVSIAKNWVDVLITDIK